MNNIKGHQDKRVHKDKLTMIELIGEKVSIPKKIDKKNAPFALYVNNNYISNNFVKEIRKHCGKKR